MWGRGFGYEIELHFQCVVLLLPAVIKDDARFKFRGLSCKVITDQVDQVDRLQTQAGQALLPAGRRHRDLASCRRRPIHVFPQRLPQNILRGGVDGALIFT